MNHNLKQLYPTENPEKFSDGFHTFEELYQHREVLFSVVCGLFPEKSWKSRQHADGSMFDGFFIVGINTPDGQYSYHYKLEFWDDFAVPELEKAPEWDGHQPSDITRLKSLL